MKTLAERLIAERKEAGLSQPELAAKAKISQSFIGTLETWRQHSSAYLPEIAYALGVHAMWLKTGLGPKHIYPTADESTHTAFAVEQGQVAYIRPAVRRICELAELVSDEGLTKAAGYLECLAGEYPLRKRKAS